MSQPKIAVIMTGNLRSYCITFRNLENYLLQPYKCDVYITTYDKQFNIKGGGNIKEDIISESNVRNVYNKYLKHLTIIPQDTFVEQYTKIKDKHYKCENEINRLYTIQKLSMLAYDIFKGECERNNRRYDIIIKMRPDILLRERFNIDMTINNNRIVVPARDSGGCFNDHLAYGRSKVMERYFTYYRTFHEIDRLEGGNACDVSIIEAGLRKNLDVVGIEIIRSPINYEILRDNKPQKIVYLGNGKGKFFVKKY